MADLYLGRNIIRDALASEGERDDVDDLAAIVRRASSPSFYSKASALKTPSQSTLNSFVVKTSSFSSSSRSQAIGVCPQSKPRAAKHRKTEMKRVVCIPALGGTDPGTGAAGQSGSGAACLLSDAWAWRKYGQKPIKGSPHPRGYYRCSSSKGCPARKQVERNPSDPSMLVVTYRGDHNHPWPLHRSINPVATTRVRDPKERIEPIDSSGSAIFATSCADDHGGLPPMRDISGDPVNGSVYADPNAVECASSGKHFGAMGAYEHGMSANDEERFMYAHMIIEQAEPCDADSERLDMAELNSLWDEVDDEGEEGAGGADPYNLFPWP